jgi:hypothetical protein
MDNLESILQSVCLPMTMTTGGTILLATTPAMSPGHDSQKQFEILAAKNALAVFTIKDAPHFTDAVKIEYLCIAGETREHAEACVRGNAIPKTTTAQREYYCLPSTDSESAIVPEFIEAQGDIVREWPRPEYYNAIVALDPGFVDRTGILYGYWDFHANRLIVEDESLLSRANTTEIAAAIRAKEAALWSKQPMVRVSDVDLRLCADLANMHQLNFTTTSKSDSMGAINVMRTMVQNRQIFINPRCVNLVRQMRNAIWNRKVTDFAKGDKIDGHYDLLAALKYMVRNAPRFQNPFPAWWILPGQSGGPPAGSFISPKGRKKPNKGLFTDTPLAKRLNKKGKK